MFAEHAFDVKHLASRGGLGAVVIPLREDLGVEAHHPPALTLVPTGVAAAPASGQAGRLPEGVYRRRRVVVAMIVVATLTLGLAWGRPDRVPPGEANPWPSAVDVSLSHELPGVYVVHPGDTLWDIALAIAPGDDPRALVHDLAEAAGGASLEPGQQIFIDAAEGVAVMGTAGHIIAGRINEDELGHVDGRAVGIAGGPDPVVTGAVMMAQTAGGSVQRQGRQAGQDVAAARAESER